MDFLLIATLTQPSYEFEIVDTVNNKMKIDIPTEQGGNSNGMRPMQTLLAALCGCSAVDIISILQKQKQTYSSFVIKVGGEREKDVELALWKNIWLQFEMQGDVAPEKLYRAVDLSISKYCSVAETLRKAGATISFTTVVNQITYQP